MVLPVDNDALKLYKTALDVAVNDHWDKFKELNESDYSKYTVKELAKIEYSWKCALRFRWINAAHDQLNLVGD